MQVRRERLRNGGIYEWRNWDADDPIVGPLRVSETKKFPDGRIVYRQTARRVKWFIPDTGLEPKPEAPISAPEATELVLNFRVTIRIEATQEGARPA